MSFLERLIQAETVVDLADIHPDVLESKIVEEDEGTEGSWEEEARAPYKVFKITKIAIRNIDEYDPELIAELAAIKVGDKIKCSFSYREDDGEEAEISGSFVVSGLRWVDDNTLELKTPKLYSLWQGETPPQSDAGRARITI